MNPDDRKEKVAPDSVSQRLCTDGRLFVRDGDGVGRYSRELHAAQGMIDPSALVVHDRYSAAPRAKTDLERLRRWTAARVAPGTVLLRERKPGIVSARDVFRRAHSHFKRRGTLLRLWLPGIAPGIIHWSYPMPLHLTGWRNVYTIHDTIPLTQPHLTTIDIAHHRHLLLAIAAKATAIATVSKASRVDIIRALGVPPDRVFDLGQPVEIGSLSAPLPAGLTPDGYFLFMGGDNPRKNGERVIVAWRRSGAGRPLVVTGAGDRWAHEPRLVRLPFQTDELLRTLMAGARALLFPSLGEGFGRPIAEAMALGTAVITARGHATEEVAGGAALLVDPLDVVELSRSIAVLDSDDSVVAGLVAAGRRHAPTFARDAFVCRLAGFYNRLIASEEMPSYASR